MSRRRALILTASLLLLLPRAGEGWDGGALAAHEQKASSQPWSPYRIVIAQPATAYPPNIAPIPLPAGTELDACIDSNGHGLSYDTTARVLTLPQPCPPRPLFRDGLED